MSRSKKSLCTANDKTLPRVTEVLRILDDSYAGVPQHAMEAAAERGELLHRLCLSYLASLDGLCEAPSVDTIPTEYRQAYLAFAQWCTANQVEPVAVEQPSISTLHRFAGTPDALVLFGPHRLLVIIDLKFTASILRTNKVQVQAYWRLDLYKDAARAMLLHISPLSGELKPHNIPKTTHDWAGFLNALSVWRWRQS